MFEVMGSQSLVVWGFRVYEFRAAQLCDLGVEGLRFRVLTL